MTTQLAAIEMESSEQYRLLLHSLTHEHAHVNVERHLLLLQKWIRDNEDGIMIRDLEYVSEILNILRGFLLSNNAVFRPVATTILTLCSKPLLETKANERLRLKGMADMKIFYKAISSFCQDADDHLKSEVIHCFRCIVSGGKDPSALRADVISWKGRGGNRVQITDTTFIQSIIRECGIIEFIVLEFLQSVDSFEERSKGFEESSMLYTQNMKKSPEKMKMKTKSKAQSLRETLREYGIPQGDEIDQEASEEEKITCIEEEDENNENNSDNGGNNSQNKNEKDITFQSVKTKKLEVEFTEHLTQDLIDLCADLAGDSQSAEIMCNSKICDGVIKFLSHLIKENFRDKRVSTTIDLLWTLLEANLNQNNSTAEKNRVFNEGNENVMDEDTDLFDILDQESAVQVLHNLMTHFSQDGFKNPDKECRNELLSVLTLIAESHTSHIHFIQSGLFGDLIYYATYAECSSDESGMFSEWLESHPQSSSNSRNFATSFELDLQYKRGLWILISDLLADGDDEAVKYVSSSPLLHSLLCYLEFDSLSVQRQVQTPSVRMLPNTMTHSQFLDFNPPEGQDYYGGNGAEGDWNGGDGGNDGNGEEGRNGGDERYGGDGGVEGGEGKGYPDSPNQSVPSSDRKSRAINCEENDPETPGVSRVENPFPGRSVITRESVDTYNGEFVRTNRSSQIGLKKDMTIAGDKSFLGTIPVLDMLGLQVLATNLLAEIGSKFLEELLYLEGPVRLYEVAVHYCYSKELDHIDMIGTLLILINRMLYASESVRNIMEELNAVQFCLFLFEQSEDECTKAQAVRAISLLCGRQNSVCQTQLRVQEGIQFLVLAIKHCVGLKKPVVGLRAGIKISDKYSMNADDPLLEPLAGDITVFAVAVLDCISQAIAGNRLSESVFASSDGLDMLLELLEVAPCVLRLQVLRLLSDLLENSDMVLLVRAWRSPKTTRSAAQLAIYCWLDEEVRLEGVRTDGVLSNIMDPLGTHVWPLNTAQIPPPESVSSIASVQTGVQTGVTGIDTNTKSLAVSRLSAAILHSRFSNNIPLGNVPMNMRKLVLEKDIRGVVASVLQLLGAFVSYALSGTDIFNSTDSEMPYEDGIGASYSMISNISVIRQNGQNGQQYGQNAHHSPNSHSMDEENSADYTAFQKGDEKGEDNASYLQSQPSSPNKRVIAASVGSLRSPFNPSIADTRENGSNGTVGGGNGYGSPARGNGGQGGPGGEDMNLNVAERQVVAIARRYAVLREGGWWREISDSLRKEGLQPIEADLTMIKAHLEIYFDASQTVQMEQMNLHEISEISLKGVEKDFISQIISRKNQDLKTAILKNTAKSGRRLSSSTRNKF